MLLLKFVAKAAVTSLVVGFWRLPGRVIADSSVNVALQASFDAGPFLLELLEAAAAENASSYFPLLDRIAEGAFDDAATEKELYDRFLTVVQDDGHINDAADLSSLKFSLAIRSAAPRVEAHYQYYNTSVEPRLGTAQDAACPVWVHMDGMQYCSPTLERAQQAVGADLEARDLPFDRKLGDPTAPLAVLYADVASPAFGEYHQKLSALAKDGQVSYVVRYRPPPSASFRPLFLAGYGVELTLKRTDYIMIDDREAEEGDEKKTSKPSVGSPSADELEEESPPDLKPLSSSEVARLGMNAASFILDSPDPFATLIKLSQDFPKYSSAVAAYNVTREFLDEYHANRVAYLPGGRNVLWINGLQIDTRQVDAYSLLEHLRHERQFISQFKKLGLSNSEAVDLLLHPNLTEGQSDAETQRYDWRDEVEGGDVIIWLNDLTKDKRYSDFPSEIDALLQPTYPGQLPAVRRDIHNVVIPVDLTNEDDVYMVVQHIQTFIKRLIPVRFGLVPRVHSESARSQAKIARHLQKTHGLAAMLKYFQRSLEKDKLARPDPALFDEAVSSARVLQGQMAQSFEEALNSANLDEVLDKTARYIKRLDLSGRSPPVLANGVLLGRGDNFLQELSMRVAIDLQIIQQSIVQDAVDEDTWLPSYFLSQAALSRNELIMPQDPSKIRIVNLVHVAESHDLSSLLRISGEGPGNNLPLMAVVGDFNSESGLGLLISALRFRLGHPEVEIVPLHTSDDETNTRVSSQLYQLLRAERVDASEILEKIQAIELTSDNRETPASEELEYWAQNKKLAAALGFPSGTRGVLLNGRAVGPVPPASTLEEDDLEVLLAYETSKRLGPVAQAMRDLKLDHKVTGSLEFAKLTSLVALSTVSDIPEGVFESRPKYRNSAIKAWNGTHSAITVSHREDAPINIVATVDPASERSQRWVPILRTLSKLDGVNVKIFLSPVRILQELPIKRFYRHVLEPEPSFDEHGALNRPGASFSRLPKDALLTLGMDVPPSWLVSPKESVHDLDNIRLSSLREGSDVDAIYELEHILIEGHSADTTTRSAPRGVQLLLGTDKNPHFADTIVMANLGYFQFKARPGFWKINLKPGPSQRIFNLDSAGGMGYQPRPGDENNEVALTSFQGRTLFPRLSRKPGHEEDDVLEANPKPGSAMDYVSKGLSFAQSILSGAGVGSKSTTTQEQHADINIFSVASGHLYERMLNIMMVSVMKHTKHSVKFWFIEQFLSPSFKKFLPHLAKEYGFSYEMVTYKWPHWLRGQREKQREIWGYKILFLDVLFPLSLDKVIFVDADQIVRTDMYDLVQLDLEGAPYGFTPMCDSRTEMEGFRFWKQGYWKSHLRGRPYHISALYVVDLNRFRALAAGDRLRGQYHTLSADPNSLANLDQDLPNNMQAMISIKSLPQEWLWCETWCADEDLKTARTIDLCNNPLTKEPKLDRARRQVPEWTEYDNEIAELAARVRTASKQSRKEDEKKDVKDEL